MEFGSLLSCLELCEADIAAAARSPDAMRELLLRFEKIAAPDEGSAIILAALARLATTAACDWLEGELRVEIEGDGARTKISVSTTIGGGFREKIFPDTTLQVPFEELSRAVALGPKLYAPLSIKERGRRLVLTATSTVRQTSLPPPMITLDPSCLMTVPRMTVPYTLPTTRSDDAPKPLVDGERKIVLRRRPRS